MHGNIHSGVDIRVHRIDEVDEYLENQYHQICSPLLTISRQLQRNLIQKLKDQQRGGKQTGLVMGRRLDAHALCRNDGKVFYKNNLPNEIPRISVGLLLDESGSMSCGDRITYARAAAIILYDFCQALDIPIMVYGHSTGWSSGVDLYSYAEFESIDSGDNYRLMDISARGSNRDGAALRYVAEQLCKGDIPYTVGGSDVAAIFGVSPWTTPLELWLVKKGRRKPSPKDNPDALEMGHLLEPIAAHWYANKLFDLLDCQEFFDCRQELMECFNEAHHYRWQAGMNGRSGGYLVLYEGQLKPTGHLSYCTSCGQRNYKSVLESTKVCGKCGSNTRVDYTKPPMMAVTFPGRGVDMGEDFSQWSMADLRDRVVLVQELDRLADDMVSQAIFLANHYDVVEEAVYVPQSRKVMAAKC